MPLEDFPVSQSRRQADHKNKVVLHHPHGGQVLSRLGDFLLPQLVLLTLLRLEFLHLSRGERPKIGWILRVRLAARWTQAILVCADSMPAKSTNLQHTRELTFNAELF